MGMLQGKRLKKKLCRRYFPLNFAKFLRTTFFTENLWTTASKMQKNWGNNAVICIPDLVEVHPLFDCEYLVSMQCKLVYDVIDGVRTNLSLTKSFIWKNPWKIELA